MSHSASEIPVAIERVDRVRGPGGDIRLRLTGRWTRPSAVTDEDPLLVVSLEGRRHRFPALDEPPSSDAPDLWEATFALPSWAEPHSYGQAAVWVGGAVVPLPPPGGPGAELPQAAPASEPSISIGRLPAPPALGEAAPWPADVAPVTVPRPPSAPVLDTGRPGPLAELLFKESVSALHVELDARAAEVARLQGELTDVRAENEARTRTQGALEAAQAELRDELRQLVTAATAQREEHAQRVAGIQQRLHEAEEALEAERARAREEIEAERTRAREEIEGERARAREEIEAERTRAREETEAEHARLAQQTAELSAARDAHAAETISLRERLTALSAAHSQHAAELAALREQVATAQVARDAATGEATGLRAELERLGTELAVAREQLGTRGGNLAEAEQLLADARALTEQLRGDSAA